MSLIFVFLLLFIVKANSVLALKCSAYPEDQPVDYSKNFGEKECFQSGCFYAKCQLPDGELLGPKYKVGCEDNSTNCLKFERECSAQNGTAHCFRCHSRDLCNNGWYPPLVRCFNYNEEIAAKLDEVGNKNAPNNSTNYPRDLTFDDFEKLKYLEGGIGTTLCPAHENMECVSVKCKIPEKAGQEGKNWLDIYKGCYVKGKLKELCEEGFKICSRQNNACKKECWACQDDFCNGVLANRIFSFGMCGILAAVSLLIVKFLVEGAK